MQFVSSSAFVHCGAIRLLDQIRSEIHTHKTQGGCFCMAVITIAAARGHCKVWYSSSPHRFPLCLATAVLVFILYRAIELATTAVDLGIPVAAYI